MLEAGSFYNPDTQDEQTLVHAAIEGLGLDRHHRFDPEESIIEWALEKVSQ